MKKFIILLAALVGTVVLAPTAHAEGNDNKQDFCIPTDDGGFVLHENVPGNKVDDLPEGSQPAEYVQSLNKQLAYCPGVPGEKGDPGEPGRNGQDSSCLDGVIAPAPTGGSSDEADVTESTPDGDSGLDPAACLRGEKGDPGEPGAAGRDGVNGDDGASGRDGRDGVDGDSALQHNCLTPDGFRYSAVDCDGADYVEYVDAAIAALKAGQEPPVAPPGVEPITELPRTGSGTTLALVGLGALLLGMLAWFLRPRKSPVA